MRFNPPTAALRLTTSVGSAAGVTQLLNGAVDFGASDMPLTDQQIAEASAKLKTTVLHFPMVLGAAVPAYNFPGLPDNLKFTPEALARHFPGLHSQVGRPRHSQAAIPASSSRPKTLP